MSTKLPEGFKFDENGLVVTSLENLNNYVEEQIKASAPPQEAQE